MIELLIPEKEWLSTAEMAQIKGISAKAVANYAADGKYHRVRKNASGHWEIHITELER